MFTILRRLLAVLVLVLTVFPLFRILEGRSLGPWGQATILQAETSLAVVVWGVGIVVLIGLVLGILLGGRVDRGWVARWRAVAGSRFPWLCALLAAALGILVSTVLLRGLLTNIDEMAMLVHARYWAAGQSGGLVGEGAAHWLIPNTLVQDGRWLSQYPPGHVALLTVGVWVGQPLLIGALLSAAIAGFGAAAFMRLFPEQPGSARLMGGVLAASPLLAVFGGGVMSHLSALAFATVALWAATRARDGAVTWAVVSGAALGWAVTSRPWSGLLLGALPLLVWWGYRDWGWFRGRLLAWVAGGVPFAAAFALYNQFTFGAPARLGYEVSYGEGHRLGFHVDPWGYPYGLVEALGYTSADLIAFGLQVLESPIPVTLLAGVFLLLAPRIDRAARVLVAWALLPVAGAFLYWFHQPRMLFESLPGWIGLGVLGAIWIVDRLRGRARAVAVGTLVASLVLGLLFFAPQRVLRYQWSEEAIARLTPPALPEPSAALVFVHASWNERLAGRLQAAGMRPDSLNPVLRRNDPCDVQLYVEARENGQVALPELDHDFAPGSPDHLRREASGPDLTLLRDPGKAWAPSCLREARADRFGAISSAPLLWQGALPGIEEDPRPMFVRDLGPERNAGLLTRYSGRSPWLLVPAEDGPLVLPYREGMELLWGEGSPMP